jgi:hypothetical protein
MSSLRIKKRIKKIMGGEVIKILGRSDWRKCLDCNMEYPSCVEHYTITRCKGGYVCRIGSCTECGDFVYENEKKCTCEGGIEIDSSFELVTFEELKKSKAAAEAAEATNDAKNIEATKRRLESQGRRFIGDTVYAECTGGCLDLNDFCESSLTGVCDDEECRQPLLYRLGECSLCKKDWMENQKSCVDKECEGALVLDIKNFKEII